MTGWHLVCPCGHNNWRPSGDGYYCKNCEVHFGELRDLRIHDVERPPNAAERAKRGDA